MILHFQFQGPQDRHLIDLKCLKCNTLLPVHAAPRGHKRTKPNSSNQNLSLTSKEPNTKEPNPQNSLGQGAFGSPGFPPEGSPTHAWRGSLQVGTILIHWRCQCLYSHRAACCENVRSTLFTTLLMNIQLGSVSWLQTDPFPLHVFLHVHIQTVLLGEGCLTLLAFVGFLSCVQSLMDLQVVGHFKTLPTLWANEWALSRVARLVLPEGLWTIENLGAEITLEFFLSQVDIIDVLIKNGLFKESFSTLFTDM